MKWGWFSSHASTVMLDSLARFKFILLSAEKIEEIKKYT